MRAFQFFKSASSLCIGLMAVTFASALTAQYPTTSDAELSEFEQHKRQLLGEFDQYKKELEDGFQAYKKTYQQAFSAYKNAINQHWGEFKPSPPNLWVSYADGGNVRRTVDYETGEVQVELLVDQGVTGDQVQTTLNAAVRRLMNTTEKEAFEADLVANRVERELLNYPNVVEKSAMGDERLFAEQDLLSLKLNQSGFMKVSAQSGDDSSATTDTRSAAKPGKDIVRITFKVPHSIHERALKYADMVAAAAKKEKIDEELIFAIMETESSFNPMAKSYVPAYGLMQIVPRTAGRDATNYLFGKAKLLAPSYLYKPENNITIGAAYLHVLHYRYMRKIKNPESRMYCAIAAYNTGASNVGRAFIDQASFTKAVPEINRLQPDQVFEKLKNQLPQKETRQYIEKVSTRMEKYL